MWRSRPDVVVMGGAFTITRDGDAVQRYAHERWGLLLAIYGDFIMAMYNGAAEYLLL